MREPEPDPSKMTPAQKRAWFTCTDCHQSTEHELIHDCPARHRLDKHPYRDFPFDRKPDPL